jgi:hypothetical protein
MIRLNRAIFATSSSLFGVAGVDAVVVVLAGGCSALRGHAVEPLAVWVVRGGAAPVVPGNIISPLYV